MIDLGQKALLGLIFAVTLFTSCKDRVHEKMVLEQQRINDSINRTVEGKLMKVPLGRLETFVHEGCEYLIYKEEGDINSAFGFMAHKGNCQNPIHSRSE